MTHSEIEIAGKACCEGQVFWVEVAAPRVMGVAARHETANPPMGFHVQGEKAGLLGLDVLPGLIGNADLRANHAFAVGCIGASPILAVVVDNGGGKDGLWIATHRGSRGSGNSKAASDEAARVTAETDPSSMCLASTEGAGADGSGSSKGPQAAESNAAPPGPGDLAGPWRVEDGVVPESSDTYRGRVQVVNHGPTTLVDWSLDDGTEQSGIGLETSGALAIGWTLRGPAGVSVYRINGGRLDGRSATRELPGEVASETLTGPSSLDGAFRLEGTSARGARYVGVVQLRRRGEGFSYEWRAGGETIEGSALLMGDFLVVGWGPLGAGGGVSIVEPGKVTASRWLGPRSSRVGREIWVRSRSAGGQ